MTIVYGHTILLRGEYNMSDLLLILGIALAIDTVIWVCGHSGIVKMKPQTKKKLNVIFYLLLFLIAVLNLLIL